MKTYEKPKVQTMTVPDDEYYHPWNLLWICMYERDTIQLTPLLQKVIKRYGPKVEIPTEE